MPKLRRLGGRDVVSIFQAWGFEVASQRGSHIKLVRTIGDHRQILTVPLHTELDTGTLRAIVRQASRFIPDDALHQQFYS